MCATLTENFNAHFKENLKSILKKDFLEKENLSTIVQLNAAPFLSKDSESRRNLTIHYTLDQTNLIHPFLNPVSSLINIPFPI